VKPSAPFAPLVWQSERRIPVVASVDVVVVGGSSAGVAAAEAAARLGGSPRALDVRELQRRLVANGVYCS